MAIRFRYSIVIPIAGRRSEMERILASLDAAAKGLPQGAHVEVHLIFDGDEEGYRHFAGGNVPLGLPRYCHLVTSGGPGAARNYGVLVSETDVVAFLDSDIIPEPDYLAGLIGYFEAHPDAQVIRGPVKALPPRASRWHRALVRGVFVANDGREWFYSSANLAWKKDAFLESGGFDPAIRLPSCEDTDLCWRWILREGCHIEFSPEMAVVHPTVKIGPWGAIREFRRRRFDGLLWARFPLRYAIVYSFRWFHFAAVAALGASLTWICRYSPWAAATLGAVLLAYSTYRSGDGGPGLQYTLRERVIGALLLPVLSVLYVTHFLEGVFSLVLMRPSNLTGRRGRWRRDTPTPLLPPGYGELQAVRRACAESIRRGVSSA